MTKNYILFGRHNILNISYDIFGQLWTSYWTGYEKCPNLAPLAATPRPLFTRSLVGIDVPAASLLPQAHCYRGFASVRPRQPSP